MELKQIKLFKTLSLEIFAAAIYIFCYCINNFDISSLVSGRELV